MYVIIAAAGTKQLPQTFAALFFKSNSLIKTLQPNPVIGKATQIYTQVVCPVFTLEYKGENTHKQGVQYSSQCKE